MPTPWGVKLYEHVFIVVDDNILVIMSDYDLDRAFLFFWDRLGLDARFNFAVNKVLNEFSNIIMSELFLLVVWKFLILHSLLDSKGRPFVGFEVEIGSVSAECLSINGSKADNALVFLCKRLKLFG